DADPVADLLENLQILEPALTAPQSIGDPQHPARSLAARRALTARLMSEEATDVVQDIDDARLIVEDRHGCGAQAETADLAGTVEVERDVQFVFRHDAHADTAGDDALRLASLPHPAAVLVDQRARRDSERYFHGPRFVDMAADVVQFRA